MRNSDVQSEIDRLTKALMKPTDEEIKEFIEYWGGDRLPDPVHYPKSFMYFWKLWKYTKEKKDGRSA